MIITAAEMHMRRAIREAAPQAKAKLDGRQVAMLARACARVAESRRPANDARTAATAGRRPTAVQSRLPLSAADVETLALIAEGRESVEIAYRLKISEHGVKVRLRRIYEVLGARNRAHAIGLGYESGLLPVVTGSGAAPGRPAAPSRPRAASAPPTASYGPSEAAGAVQR